MSAAEREQFTFRVQGVDGFTRSSRVIAFDETYEIEAEHPAEGLEEAHPRDRVGHPRQRSAVHHRVRPVCGWGRSAGRETVNESLFAFLRGHCGRDAWEGYWRQWFGPVGVGVERHEFTIRFWLPSFGWAWRYWR